MMPIGRCLYPDDGAAFVLDTLSFADCQARTLGYGGYHALAAAGSDVSIALAGLLVVSVALFGYRLLLGDMPGIRDVVLAVARIGVVLTLATAWPAFRVMVYDVVLRAPAQLAAQIGRGDDLPGATGGLVGRLQGVDGQFLELIRLGSAPAPVPAPSAGASAAAKAQVPPLAFDPIALGGARLLYAASATGLLAGLWLAAGVLLALGPLFAAALLFDATRGLFLSWAKALAGLALGACGTAIALGVELAMLEPKLSRLIARRLADRPIEGAPAELLLLTMAAIAVLAVMLFAITRATAGLRLMPTARGLAAAPIEHRSNPRERPIGDPRPPSRPSGEMRPRTAAIAEAVMTRQRWEEARGAVPSPARPAVIAGGEPVVVGAAVRGGEVRRNIRGRATQSGIRRDRGR